MNSKEQAFIELVDALNLETSIKGMLDLCKGVTLFELFYSIINEQDKLVFVKDNQIIHQINDQLSYEDHKRRNLDILIKSLNKYASLKNIEIKINKPDIRKIALENNTEELKLLIKIVFKVLMVQGQLIQTITSLSKQTQRELMEIFQEIMSLQAQQQQNQNLLEKICQLQNQIEERDQIKKQAFENIKQLTHQNQQLRNQINQLKKEMIDLRQKNESLQEFENIFTKKDADIATLNQKNQQLKLVNIRQKQQYEKQILELEKIIQTLKKSLNKHEGDSEVQKFKHLLEEKGKDLEETTLILQQQRNLLKKLRQRCSVLEEKNKSFDDIRLQFELKLQQNQMQKDTLNMKLYDLEQRIRDDEQRRQNSIKKERKSEILGFQLNAKFDDDFDEQCLKQECQKQKQQLVIYKNKCLELIKNNQLLRGNFTQRSNACEKQVEQTSLRLSNITIQNVNLKQNVANAHHLAKITSKQSQQAVIKYKRRYLNLKKKVAQDEQIKNAQIQIMTTALYELRKIIQQNLSGPKLLEVIRKIK